VGTRVPLGWVAFVCRPPSSLLLGMAKRAVAKQACFAWGTPSPVRRPPQVNIWRHHHKERKEQRNRWNPAPYPQGGVPLSLLLVDLSILHLPSTGALAEVRWWWKAR
jgi:hypothetical protein